MDQNSAVTYEIFYNEYYPMIIRYLTKKCSSPQDAEDLANECFLYCYKNWNQYDPDKSTRKTWLYLVVQSRWKNYLRDRKQHYNLEDFENIIPGKDLIEQAVRLQAIRTELSVVLQQLPENQREAVILRFFRQWTDDEIAEWLGISKGNVRVIIHRALQYMSKKYESVLRQVL